MYIFLQISFSQFGFIVSENRYHLIGFMRIMTHFTTCGFNCCLSHKIWILYTFRYIFNFARLLFSHVSIMKPKRFSSICTHALYSKSLLCDLKLDFPCEYLKWNGVKKCAFVDKGKRDRHYWVQFAIGFHRHVQEPEGPIRWPLIAYLHWTGGKVFFTNSKASVITAGLQFVSSKVMEISSQCQWNWKDTPGDWVLELKSQFKAVEGIDVNCPLTFESGFWRGDTDV